ncbi:MAG: mechanosensitive ion channel family protein, partial [Anaerolineales bacterium]
MQEYFSTLAAKFIESLPNMIFALLILAASYFVANLSSRLLK